MLITHTRTQYVMQARAPSTYAVEQDSCVRKCIHFKGLSLCEMALLAYWCAFMHVLPHRVSVHAAIHKYHIQQTNQKKEA